MEMNHTSVEFSQITDLIYLGTNLCCTHKPHIQIILDLGISADIDLEEERQEQTPGIEVYLWLPVIDKQAPSQTQFRVGVAAIDKLVKEGKKIYIHCKNGHGRSPTLLAAYFIYKGDSLEQAIERIRIKRPEIHLEQVQIEALKKFNWKDL